MGDLDSIPGLRRSLGEGKGYPLQYSGLENSMDYVSMGVSKSWTQLSVREKEQKANSALETQDEKGALPWAGGLDLRGSCKP